MLPRSVLLRKLDVGLPRPSRPLFKRVQNVDRFGELSDIEDPILTIDMDANLTHAGTDKGQWLPVVWIKSLLYEVELVPSPSASAPATFYRA